MRIRRLTSFTALLLIFSIVIVLSASRTGMAMEKDCVRSVTVTDGEDTFAPGQLRTAISEVCQGGRVEVASSVSEIWVGSTIVIDKNVKVSGTGQTIYRGSVEVFDVSTNGVLHLTDFTMSGPSPYPAITVEGALILKNVTVTLFMNAIVAEPGSFVTLNKDTLITGNFSDRWEGGAGIYINGGTVELFDNATVTDNVGWACFTAPGIPAMGWGGGIFSKNGGFIALHDDAVVSRNGLLYCDPAKEGWGGRGGGVTSIGGTVTLDGSAKVSGNWAATSAGIYLYNGGSLTLQDNAAVTDNYSEGSGGGVGVLLGQLTMTDFSTISGNIAVRNGGGVVNASGVVTLEDHAEITGNSAGNGGGVYSSDLGGSYPPPELVVKDYATISGNTPNDIVP